MYVSKLYLDFEKLIVDAITINIALQEKKNYASYIGEFYINRIPKAHDTITYNLEDVDFKIHRINQHEPIQYVVGFAYTMYHKLMVNKDVLIPRPETDELIQWIIEDNKFNLPSRILDIGCGSGVISLALKNQFPNTELWGMDISPEALDVTKANMSNFNLSLHLVEDNILNPKNVYPSFDIIVSNPPYIDAKEMSTMDVNVVNYEPHIALFVNNDVLEYYKAIIAFANDCSPLANIYVETHENFAHEVLTLFKENNYTNCELRKDLQGKNRMIKAKN